MFLKFMYQPWDCDSVLASPCDPLATQWRWVVVLAASPGSVVCKNDLKDSGKHWLGVSLLQKRTQRSSQREGPGVEFWVRRFIDYAHTVRGIMCLLAHRPIFNQRRSTQFKCPKCIYCCCSSESSLHRYGGLLIAHILECSLWLLSMSRGQADIKHYQPKYHRAKLSFLTWPSFRGTTISCVPKGPLSETKKRMTVPLGDPKESRIWGQNPSIHFYFVLLTFIKIIWSLFQMPWDFFPSIHRSLGVWKLTTSWVSVITMSSEEILWFTPFCSLCMHVL